MKGVVEDANMLPNSQAARELPKNDASFPEENNPLIREVICKPSSLR
jgi:hypothetical protein